VGDDWVIEQGLQPGDRVVVEGLLAARPGAVVRAVPFRNEMPGVQRQQAPARAE
jgi:membrane fusion protein (multidrug efflux system)